VESLWKYADENYVYFDYKSINWASRREFYLNKTSNMTSEDSLFKICSAMVAELKDGHNSLNNGKNIYKYNYVNGYNVNFSLEIVKSKYLKNTFQTKGNFTYGIINDSIGYVYYEKFYGGSVFNEVIQFFKDKKVEKIIIDIRNNGGGLPETAQNIVGYFVDKPTLIGYITHKGGKGHSDFSTKIEVNAMPKSIFFDKAVRVLTNRKSFSASSYLAGMMNNLPNVKLIGQITGGGGGAAADFELPNGWTVGMTSNFFLDNKNNHIENGVKPTIEIENSLTDITNQQDKMLEKAIGN
jgi:C-terminal processing protease CtpA/Prc